MRRLMLIDGNMYPATEGEYCDADDAVKQIEELADHIEELQRGIEDFIHGDDGDVDFYRKQLRGLLDKGGE